MLPLVLAPEAPAFSMLFHKVSLSIIFNCCKGLESQHLRDCSTESSCLGDLAMACGLRKSASAIIRAVQQQPRVGFCSWAVRIGAAQRRTVANVPHTQRSRTNTGASKWSEGPRRQSNARTIRPASSTAGTALKRTPLYETHVKHGATMVPFGGFEMPVQYSDLSIGESHNWTREKASIFDVSHM